MPGANESVVETQGLDLVNLVPKVTPPICERPGIIFPEFFRVKKPEVGAARKTAADCDKAGQKASGENVMLNEIDRLAITIVAMVGNGDYLSP